jgi:hypothetical protein
MKFEAEHSHAVDKLFRASKNPFFDKAQLSAQFSFGAGDLDFSRCHQECRGYNQWQPHLEVRQALDRAN